jgi:hypothetical protein
MRLGRCQAEDHRARPGTVAEAWEHPELVANTSIGVASVAIDPAQIKGVLPLPLAQLRAALSALGNPANLHRAVSLTLKEFRFGFGNALTEEESADLFDKWAIPSPARPLFEAAAANFSVHSQAKVDTGNETRGPLLLISGAEDHAVPDVRIEAGQRLRWPRARGRRWRQPARC